MRNNERFILLVILFFTLWEITLCFNGTLISITFVIITEMKYDIKKLKLNYHKHVRLRYNDTFKKNTHRSVTRKREDVLIL